MDVDASVVISTYNRRDMLQLALASAQRQRDVDLEIIVVDNGSTDGTSAMLADLRDPRLHIITNDVSLGPTGGRNCGLERARGRWVAILDDDDLWAPTKLRDQIAAAESAQSTWAYTGCVYINDDGTLLGGTMPLDPDDVVTQLPVRYVVSAGLSSMAWRRDSLPRGGRLDSRMTHMVDWDLSLQLLATGPPAAVMAPLVAYRQHSSNFSRGVSDVEPEMELIASKHADLRAGRTLDVGAQSRFFGATALRAGQRRTAMRYFMTGAKQGDLGCVARIPTVILPTRSQLWARRRLASETNWLAQANTWLTTA
ncbi:hypothetical protein BH24ACT15_BH24ACT15_38240 [soil metagenome]